MLRRCSASPWPHLTWSQLCGQAWGVLAEAVTCLSEQGGSAAVGDCVRWAGAMPALVQECHVPCKDDCTFTPWSKFTACSSDCDTARSRRRSLTGRSRKRDKCQNTELYPQVETEPCPCEAFTSQPHGNWSDCIIRGGPAELQLGMAAQAAARECGQGVRLRAIACYDRSGRLVEPSLCSTSGPEAQAGGRDLCPEPPELSKPGVNTSGQL
ncbi:hypothetical protein EK904_012654 [Melospiza melodia maxima]|nr:hypothetical protein EK904_012654 [Melospiza melodia maxima]